MKPELARVIALAKRRGACVRVVLQATWDRMCEGDRDSWHHSPFTHMSLGIDEQERRVYLLKADANDPEAAGSVIHELGHLHATRRESVSNANEYGWMAWEIAVAREARARQAWDAAMKDYGLGVVSDALWHLGMRHADIAARHENSAAPAASGSARHRWRKPHLGFFIAVE